MEGFINFNKKKEKNFISDSNSNANNPNLNPSQNKNDYMKNDMLKVVNKMVKNSIINVNQNHHIDPDEDEKEGFTNLADLDLIEINNALVSYSVVSETLKLEGIKMILDSFNYFNFDDIERFYDLNQGVTRIQKFKMGMRLKDFYESISELECYMGKNNIYDTNIKKEEVLNFDLNLLKFESDEKISDFKIPKPSAINYTFKGSCFNTKILSNTTNKATKNKNNNFNPIQISQVPIDSGELSTNRIVNNFKDLKSNLEDNKLNSVIEEDNSLITNTNNDAKSENKNEFKRTKTMGSRKSLGKQSKKNVSQYNQIHNHNDQAEKIYYPTVDRQFIIFNNNCKILKETIPNEYIENLLVFDDFKKIPVYGRNKIIDFIQICYKDEERDFMPKIISDIYEEDLIYRANLMIRSRFDFFFKICKIAARFLVNIKKAYQRKKEKLLFIMNEAMENNNKVKFSTMDLVKNPQQDIKEKVVAYKDKLKCDKLLSCFNNEEVLNEYKEITMNQPNNNILLANMGFTKGGISSNQNQITSTKNASTKNKFGTKNLKNDAKNFNDESKLSKMESGKIGEVKVKKKETLTKNYALNSSKDKDMTRRSSKNSGRSGSYNNILIKSKKEKEIVNIKKLKGFLSKNMKKQNLQVQEEKRRIAIDALYGSMKVIKREDNEQKLNKQLEENKNSSQDEDDLSDSEKKLKNDDDINDENSSQYTKKLEKEKSKELNVKKTSSLFKNDAEPNKDNSVLKDLKSLDSFEKEEYTKLRKTMVSKTLKKKEKEISPTKRIDVVGLKLFIKDSLAKKVIAKKFL